jgi:Zn2+/Cd2+-exporting ATPase
MDCAAEASEIRHAVDHVPGIRDLRFDLQARIITVDAPPNVLQAALLAIQRIGYEPLPVSADDAQQQPVPLQPTACDCHDPGHNRAPAAPANRQAAEPRSSQPAAAVAQLSWRAVPRRLVWALLLAGFAEAWHGVDAWAGPPAALAQGVPLVLALAAISLSGANTYRKGLRALRVGHLNINALMTVAVTGACVIGQWAEAGMVMALYALAEWIEAQAAERARGAIQALMAMAPELATVQQADGSWQTTPVAQVPVGAVLRLRPGERVPLDGRVLSGLSAVDQAPVTGESVPVDKQPGDSLFAGSLNQSGELSLEVSALARDSTLTRILQAVEQAQGQRAPMQRWVDRFAAIYTPTVLAGAVAVAVLAPWWLGWTPLRAVYEALVLLVIACPCALLLSTPVTVVSGLAVAARRGVLIKGGVHLEQARLLRAVALDKTGTLTLGEPRLVQLLPIGEAQHADHHQAIAKALAERSDHPISRAVAQGLLTPALPLMNFQALAGRGVQATLEGQTWHLGSRRWMRELGLLTPDLERQLDQAEQSGHTLSLLAQARAVVMVFALADVLRPGAAQAMSDLKALGITPVMLTGDRAAAAQAIALAAGITEVRAELLPEDKLQALAGLQQRLGPTAMVGDGINDAPALACSDMGFAMGAQGTHIAIEAADVVIMNSDLRRVAQTVTLSRRTHALLWQNIALALGIKAVFMVLALMGLASMWMAVFADMGASLLVVFNGLRLLRSRSIA